VGGSGAIDRSGLFVGQPKIPEDVDKQAAGGRCWWPDWKNPVVWLLVPLRATTARISSPAHFLGDYLAALGKPKLLGAALGWLNGSQLVAMAVLCLTANRMQMRTWPFLDGSRVRMSKPSLRSGRKKIPAALQMADQAMCLVLGGDRYAADAGIERVRERKIDNPQITAEIHLGLRAHIRQFR
jgi:hypothetical protein